MGNSRIPASITQDRVDERAPRKTSRATQPERHTSKATSLSHDSAVLSRTLQSRGVDGPRPIRISPRRCVGESNNPWKIGQMIIASILRSLPRRINKLCGDGSSATVAVGRRANRNVAFADLFDVAMRQAVARSCVRNRRHDQSVPRARDAVTINQEATKLAKRAPPPPGSPNGLVDIGAFAPTRQIRLEADGAR